MKWCKGTPVAHVFALSMSRIKSLQIGRTYKSPSITFKINLITWKEEKSYKVFTQKSPQILSTVKRIYNGPPYLYQWSSALNMCPKFGFSFAMEISIKFLNLCECYCEVTSHMGLSIYHNKSADHNVNPHIHHCELWSWAATLSQKKIIDDLTLTRKLTEEAIFHGTLLIL